MSTTQPSIPAVTSVASDFATFGPAHLDVTDMQRALGFWRDVIGLRERRQDEDGLRLGVADRDLVVLHPGARGPVVREASGLYHLSFHLPSLEEFARAFVRVEAAGYFQFPTDHGMHLANYIDDPDGIGVELAFESPAEVRASWGAPPGFEPSGHGGRHWEGREPRYLEWLAAQAPESDTRGELGAGAIMGHIHLRAADNDDSMAFYRDAIGFTVNSDSRSKGFFDMSAGGTFSHRLACNTWESAGRPQRPADAAGLRHFTLQLRSEGALTATVARAETVAGQVERRDDGVMVLDPSGTPLLLTATAA